MPGWIFHYLLSVVPGKEGRGMREGGQLNLFVATAETGLPVLGSCGYNWYEWQTRSVGGKLGNLTCQNWSNIPPHFCSTTMRKTGQSFIGEKLPRKYNSTEVCWQNIYFAEFCPEKRGKMSFSSDEVNFLVYRYLQVFIYDCNFIHCSLFASGIWFYSFGICIWSGKFDSSVQHQRSSRTTMCSHINHSEGEKKKLICDIVVGRSCL